MRAGRLVSILLLLQVHGRLSAAELAHRLEVSVRTVYRDLDALSEAGVPVCTQGGAGGGCWLLDGYRTRLTGLTAEEAQALLLAGVPGPAGELGLGTALAAGQLKLLAALPADLGERAGRARGRFHLDAPGWFGRGDQGEHAHLATIAAALWDDRLLALEHRRDGREAASRVVEPLGLVLKAGVWYLVARLPGPGEPHVYRVSRVVAATALEESFSRPDDFDLGAFWSDWSRAFEAGLPRVSVLVRLAPGAFVPDAQAASGGPEADGWSRATMTFERLEWAVGPLLALGSAVEVLEPADLRARVAAAARAAADIYRLSPLQPEQRGGRHNMALNDQVKFTWVGHGTWKIRTAGGKDVLIDPWFSGSPVASPDLKPDKLDIMVLTHGHFDHVADAVDIAKATSCKVIAPFEVGNWLPNQGVEGDNVIGMGKGGTIEVEGITFTMVHAEHFSSFPDGSYAGEPVGYVIEFENGFKVYFAGDTDVFGDMALIRELDEPEVAFLPIGDFYTMGPKRAAKAVQLLGVKTVVPMHFGTFPALAGTPAQLEELVGPGVTVLDVKPGDEV